MAGEVTNDVQQGNTVFEAAAAIEKLLAGETEAGPIDQPEPQPEAQAAPAEETPASEDVETPAQDTAAEAKPEASKPVTSPQNSPELDARLQEADRVKQEATAARDKTLAILNTVTTQLESQINGDFGDIKTQADVITLMKNDPARYNDWAVRQQQLQFARNMQQQTQAEADKTRMDAEGAALGKRIPELLDKEKAPALVAKLKDFATKQNISAERQARWTADDVVLLHTAMQSADKVAAYESQRATDAKKLEEAKAKAAKAPPVQKPGVARSESSKDEAAKTDFDRLKKSGRVDDAADVFRHILN